LQCPLAFHLPSTFLYLKSKTIEPHRNRYGEAKSANPFSPAQAERVS
jgi:hypothetical protein